MTCLHSHIFIYSNLILFNDSKICITFPLTLCTIHKYKTGDDVSEFMHSNGITLCYDSSLKHKSLIPKYSIHFSFTSVHSNLEHGLAILQRALVHSNLNYTTILIKVQSRSPLQ